MNPNRTAKGDGILWAVFLIPVLWAAMLAAPCTGEGLAVFVEKFPAALSAPFYIEWCAASPKCLLLASAAYGLGAAVYYGSNSKKRPGEEHGSARWGSPKQVNAALAQKDNIPLTRHVRIGLDAHKHRRCLNILVLGGSGSGKTRSLALPSVMECNCSYVITDAKAEILKNTGHLLIEQGYTIKVLDLINFERSDGYNPFRYIRDDKDVLRLITNLIRNTTPRMAASSDPFWEKAEVALLEALMFYLLYEAPEDEMNFGMIMTMLEYADVREEDSSYISPLDMLFNQLGKVQPDHIAVRQYRVYRQAAGKTAKSILISVAVRLAAFNLSQIRSLTSHDEMDIGELGEKKTALYAVIPDNDTSLSYLVGMLYTQIIQELYYRADHIHGGSLPVHVRFILDEFANVSLPEEFDKSLSTMRSRSMSATIIVQNLAQLKGLYKEHGWETITGNCDTLLFLGGNEASTHEYISKLLGKETIDAVTHGQTKGRSGSYSTNFQITGRELLDPAEVRLMDNRCALLFIRGFPPVIDEKYDLMRHPNIKKTKNGGYPPYLHKEKTFEGIPFAEAFDFAHAEDYELYEGDE